MLEDRGLPWELRECVEAIEGRRVSEAVGYG